VDIKNTGVVCFKTKKGAFDGDSFLTFINDQLSEHFVANPNDILVMDNCRFHHRRDVLFLFQEKRITYIFTPPYSPQLNPIEEYFIYFESKISRLITINMNVSNVEVEVNEFLRTDASDFNGRFRNMRRYVALALSRQEFI
jgi:hypothetical protein